MASDFVCLGHAVLLVLLCSNGGGLFERGMASPDYLTALRSSLLFFEGQRSGPLPASQRAHWRADSALHDGLAQGVDLVGGYYDAGDNVKFGLPMAFTITMLSWSAIEYGSHIAAVGELEHVMEAIKWGTDYFIKAHTEPNVLWGEVGDGDSDHYCWQRPEEMTTSRRAYKLDPQNPGSDLVGETAAAMATASIVFRRFNSAYAYELLNHAKQLFSFADTYRGRYDSSITVARNYYQSESGYGDELLWAALWLYEATADNYYLNYAVENAHFLGGIGWSMTEFSWDVKYAGLQVLASKVPKYCNAFFIHFLKVWPAFDSSVCVLKVLFEGRGRSNEAVLQSYRSQADFFSCACLQRNYGKNIRRTPGGLMYTRAWNNMQYATSASFLLAVYSDYLSAAKQEVHCVTGHLQPSDLLDVAKLQIDYILGDNPRGTSYMVGVGGNFPRRIHHRGASIVSYKLDRSFVACREGYQTWYSSSAADPNVHVGALVGGPDENDNYADSRENWDQSEPAIYNNGPLVGVLARLHISSSTYSMAELLPAALPTLTTSASSEPEHASHSPFADLFISQTITSSWNIGGDTYYRYQVTVQNNSRRLLKHMMLEVESVYGPIWGLSKAGPDSYTFPTWMSSLPSGKSMVFVYVQSAPKAKISVSSASFD